MYCPRDKSRLHPHHKRSQVLGCLKCGGQVIHPQYLRQLIPLDVLNRIKLVSRSYAIDPHTRCPLCAHFMKPAPLPPEYEETEIDICTKCSSIWFDRGELNKASLPGIPAKPTLEMTPVSDLSKLAGALISLPIEEDPTENQNWSETILLISALVFFVSFLGLRDITFFSQKFGFIPNLAFSDWYRWITAFFVHGSLGYLLGNLYFFCMMSDDVEEYLGTQRFIILLLLSTFGGHIAALWVDAQSNIPHVGASGGISGVMSFYALAFPKARILFCRLFFLSIGILRVPAIFVFFVYVATQVWGATAPQESRQISFESHLGGMFVGILLLFIWEKRPPS